MKKLLTSRFSTYFSIIFIYLALSLVIRLVLSIFVLQKTSLTIVGLLKIFIVGIYFDFAAATFFTAFYLAYLMIMPSKLIGSLFDKIVTFFQISIILFLMLFSLASEVPFWDEFGAKFNFIAVDYLIYTYEVIENINQSFPIPLILTSLFILLGFIFYSLKKKNIFNYTFTSKNPLKYRIIIGLIMVSISAFYIVFSNNKQAEWSQNFYENELSKNGTYSFFAAYIANELDYNTFYKTLDQKQAYSVLKKELIQKNQKFTKSSFDEIERMSLSKSKEERPNIVLITIESFSADFLKKYGNNHNLTPNYDKLIGESVSFNNMYATGTRTIRGMEALTLSVPPTPGNSIVRRPNNESLFSIANPLRERNYSLKFIYGGDGYFDNMNSFFGGQGFDIVDRDRGNPLSDKIKTKRYTIPNSEVNFENAWGICDEDIYKQSIKQASLDYKNKKSFFQFIMTTSNHKPYTFPEGKIDLKSGSRESAVKYTDYALGEYIKNVKKMPWFKNTIFIIVADHCANSAGKWEINIEKHHIPAIVYNLGMKEEINTLCSQIDLMPTVFSFLHWNYKSNFYGKDIRLFNPSDERALIGNYRTLGLLKHNLFTQLNDRRDFEQFYWNQKSKNLIETKSPIDSLLNLTISYYQTASERFKNGKMKSNFH